jgi:hypothetical protein
MGATEVPYEDTAQWVVEEMSSTLLDTAATVTILSRSWRDNAFMRELLANPRSTIERELGIEFDSSATVEVFVETPNSLAFVLPDITDSAALRDGASDLDDVLMLNILSGPCHNSHATCAGSF